MNERGLFQVYFFLDCHFDEHQIMQVDHEFRSQKIHVSLVGRTTRHLTGKNGASVYTDFSLPTMNWFIEQPRQCLFMLSSANRIYNPFLADPRFHQMIEALQAVNGKFVVLADELPETLYQHNCIPNNKVLVQGKSDLPKFIRDITFLWTLEIISNRVRSRP